jgi:hypothetical protein
MIPYTRYKRHAMHVVIEFAAIAYLNISHYLLNIDKITKETEHVLVWGMLATIADLGF